MRRFSRFSSKLPEPSSAPSSVAGVLGTVLGVRPANLGRSLSTPLQRCLPVRGVTGDCEPPLDECGETDTVTVADANVNIDKDPDAVRLPFPTCPKPAMHHAAGVGPGIGVLRAVELVADEVKRRRS